MNLKTFTSEESKIAQEIWQSIEKTRDYVPFNAQWEYIETWIQSFGHNIPHWYLVGYNDKRPVAICLLVEEVGRNILFPIKAYSYGPDGENYSERIQLARNAFLSIKEYEQLFIKKCIEHTVKNYTFDEINAVRFSKPDTETILSVIKKQNLHYSTTTETSYIFDLESEETDIFAMLSYDMRHQIRRSAKAFNDLEVIWAENQFEADEIFTKLIILHTKSWQRRGRAGVFAKDSNISFHRNLIPKLLPKKRIGLVEVKSKRLGTVGCLYFFIDDDHIFGYQSGFAEFEQLDFPEVNIKRIKPGYISHVLCMGECKKRGYRFYNFGPGYHTYKKELSNTTLNETSIHVRNGVKPKIREFLLEEYKKLDDTNNPLLKYLLSLKK